MSERTCPNCRTSVPARRHIIPAYCPNCGARLPTPVPPPVPVNYTFRTGTLDTAVASFVCGLLGFCMPFIGTIMGIVAIVLGAGARRRIRESSGRLRGDGLATAGIVLGVISASFWSLTCVAAGA